MNVSTWTIIAGLGLVLLPFPPFTTVAAGLLLMAAGAGMKLFSIA